MRYQLSNVDQVLSTNGDSPAWSIIFILSDGLEDTPPLLNDTMNDVTATGAFLKAMAYSTEFTENLHLPNEEGGEGFVKSFTDDDTTAEPPPKLEDEEYLDTDKFVTVQNITIFSNNTACIQAIRWLMCYV